MPQLQGLLQAVRSVSAKNKLTLGSDTQIFKDLMLARIAVTPFGKICKKANIVLRVKKPVKKKKFSSV